MNDALNALMVLIGKHGEDWVLGEEEHDSENLALRIKANHMDN